MREVTTYKAVEIYLLKLDEKKIPRSELVKGFPVALDDLVNKKHRMDWGLFVALTKRHAELVGGREEMVSTGYNLGFVKPVKTFWSIISLFKDPKSMYKAMVELGGPAVFLNVAFQCTDTGENSLRIDITLPEEYEDCPEFFYIYKGVYAAMPVAFHIPYAIIEMDLAPRHGTYNIILPPSTTLYTRFKVALRAFKGAKDITDELIAYQSEIRESYRRLEQANRELEEQQLKLDLLEQVSSMTRLAAVDHLAGGVGHEINNPLMVLSLNTDLLADMAKAGQYDRQTMLDRLRRMREANLRMVGITSALKDIGSCDPNKPEKSVLLRDVFETIKNICLIRFEKNGVDLRIARFEEGLAVRVRSFMLSHTLLHLLNNAFDAVMEMGDERWIEIGVEDVGEEVEIRVTDSGPGISSEVAREMFVPFFTTKQVGKGSGLGLSLAKKYVEMHGSTLEYETKEGHASFFFRMKKDAAGHQRDDTAQPLRMTCERLHDLSGHDKSFFSMPCRCLKTEET